MSHLVGCYFACDLEGTEKDLTFSDFGSRHFSGVGICTLGWRVDRFSFCGPDVHFCFSHVALGGGDGLWEVFAYQVGGEARSGCIETCVDGGHPCGRNGAKCGLVEVGHKVS